MRWPTTTRATCCSRRIAASREIAGQHGTIRAMRTEAWLPDDPAALHPIRRATAGAAEQLHRLGTRKHSKLLRRLEAGPNPEIEIGQLPHARRVHPRAAARRMAGVRAGGRRPVALAVLHGLVHNEGETWERTLDELGRYFERVTGGGAPPPAGIADGGLVPSPTVSRPNR